MPAVVVDHPEQMHPRPVRAPGAPAGLAVHRTAPVVVPVVVPVPVPVVVPVVVPVRARRFARAARVRRLGPPPGARLAWVRGRGPSSARVNARGSTRSSSRRIVEGSGAGRTPVNGSAGTRNLARSC